MLPAGIVHVVLSTGSRGWSGWAPGIRIRSHCHHAQPSLEKSSPREPLAISAKTDAGSKTWGETWSNAISYAESRAQIISGRVPFSHGACSKRKIRLHMSGKSSQAMSQDWLPHAGSDVEHRLGLPLAARPKLLERHGDMIVQDLHSILPRLWLPHPSA